MFSRAAHSFTALASRRYPAPLSSTHSPTARYQPSPAISWSSPGLRHTHHPSRGKPRHRYRPRPWFSTLDPTRLSPKDYCDISGRCTVRPLSETKERVSPTTLLYHGMQYYRSTPFPPGSHGFFYYHPSSTTRAPDNSDGRTQDGPRESAGDLRFRVTPTNDPASFAEGHDLRHVDGLPWTVSLERIATNSAAGDLRAILVRDKFITEEMLERECERVRWRRKPSRGVVCASRRVVSSLGQPFSASLSRKNWCFAVDSLGDPERTERNWAHLPNIFLQPNKRPYFKGKMVCCVERSPFPEHADLPILAIRVLQITDPLVPLAPLPPERAMDVPVEGALILQKGSPHLHRAYRSKPLRQLLLSAEAASVSGPVPSEPGTSQKP
ncbi:hypothetical protein DENSPDRAFT_288216 [Dentipellis sp. KUC8613]|nr:hypothetical protein DENSPDRAFT_288216 [Dentipellis sp. KUC8613]